MESYDIIMLVVLVGATVFGAWKGLAWQVASLASIFVSYSVALEFRDEVSQHITADPPWNVFCAMLILYLGTSLAIWIAFRLVHNFIDRHVLQLLSKLLPLLRSGQLDHLLEAPPASSAAAAASASFAA